MSNQLQVSGAAKIRDIQGPVVANDGIITALDGLASQYVRGDGALADFPTTTGGGSSVSYYLNGSISQGTIGGVAYKQLSKTPIIGGGTDFTISSPGYIASFITDIGDPAADLIPGGNWNLEFYFNSSSVGGTPYFYVDVYKYDGTTFTLIGTQVAAPEYINSGTIIDAYYTAVPIPQTVLATTDRIAMRVYVETSAKTITLHTENTTLCQVVTTFSRGMTTLNNLTKQVQYLAVGTAGTDFNISSVTDIHTFNLPVASSTKTGKLSNTDWSTFNNKVPYTGATESVDLGNNGLLSSQLISKQGLIIEGDGINDGGNLQFKQYPSVTSGTLGYTTLSANDSTSFNIWFNQPSSINYKNVKLSSSLLTNNIIRTYSFPDLSGTLALLEGTQTFTGAKTFSLDILVNSLTIGRGLGNIVTNTAVGIDSLDSNTTGYENTAIGYATLSVNTTGNINTANGTGSLMNNTTGSENSALGHGALGANTTGLANTAVGISALGGNTTANLNTAIGSYALWNNTTGAYNTAIGASAMQSNSTGTRNTTIGWEAGSSISTGSNNTIIGIYSGTTTMSNNVILADGQGNIRYQFNGTKNIFNNNVDLGIYTLNAGNIDANGISTSGGAIRLKQNGIINTGPIGYTTLSSAGAGLLDIYFGDSNLYSVELTNNLLTANRVYNFPNASGTVALTSDLGNYVTLTSTQIITGNKIFNQTQTFNNGIISTGATFLDSVSFFKQTVAINYATDYTSVVGIPNGLRMGLSTSRYSDFIISSTTNYSYTFPNASGTIALTSDLSAYLPLTGGTLTGALNLTYAAPYIYLNASTGSIGSLVFNVNNSLVGNINVGNSYYQFTNLTTGGWIFKNSLGNNVFTIADAGQANLSSTLGLGGALTGTSATFIVNQNSTITNSFQNTNTTSTSSRNILNITAGNATLQLQAINGDNVYISPATAIDTYLGFGNSLRLASTGAATFSSSVTMGSGSAIIGANNGLKIGYDNLGGGMYFADGNNLATFKNWRIATSYAVGGDLSFTPSTTNGGTTFSTPALTILSNGNVGIGTSSPTDVASTWTTLQVTAKGSGGGGILYLTNFDSTVKTQIYSDNSTGRVGTTTNHNFILETNSAPRMTITSGGKVLIGTTTDSSAAKLVTEGADGQVISQLRSSSGMIQFYPYFSTYSGPIIQALTGNAAAYIPLRIECSTMTVAGNQTVTGTKSFAIEHPLDNTKTLLHYSTESPKADLIYRGKINLVNGKAKINIDLSSKMTEGTFVALCRNVQCFTTNETGWDMVKGKVKQNILTIESNNENSTDEISWMVIGERYDESIKNSNMLDKDGDLIVEKEREIKSID